MEWSTKEWQHNYKQLGDAHIQLDNKIGDLFISFYNDKKPDFTYDNIIFSKVLNLTDSQYDFQVHIKIKKIGG
ncbi:hypothetical protein ACNQ1T_03345 [Mycoplasma sp. 1932B]|uniref:hypothetical protein n=1 Tax=Mycoplasma sp. 1932B TaxID=3401670 RepID=UPI003AAC0174